MVLSNSKCMLIQIQNSEISIQGLQVQYSTFHSSRIKCNAKLLDHTGTSNQSLHESLHSTCAFMFIDEDLLLKSKVGICNGFNISIALLICT